MFNFFRSLRTTLRPASRGIPRSGASYDPDDARKSEHILAWYVAPDGKVSPLKSVNGGIDFATMASRDKGFRPFETDYALAYSVTEWVYRCVEVVSTKVGELLNACKIQDVRTGKILEQHPYLDGVTRAFRFYRQDIYTEWMRALCVFGENYTEKVRALDSSQPFTLRWLNPLAIEPFIPSGRIERFDYYGDDGQNIQFKPYEITYHYTRNYFDDLRGLSPMRRALQAVNLDMHYQRAYDSFYTNGAQPGLIISPKDAITPNDWERFKTYIQQDLKGVVNAYKTLTPNFAADITTVEIPAPMYSEELRADQKERIAAVFGVPVGMVTFGDAKYQLSPEQRKSFYEETVIPRATDILRVINADTLRFFDPYERVELILDTTPISAVIEDAEMKQRIALADYHGGVITFNQLQTQRDLPPVDGGDFYLFPQDKVIVPTQQLGQAAALIQQRQVTQPPAMPALYNGSGASAENGTNAIEAHDHEIIIEPDALRASLTEPRHKNAVDELRAWQNAYRSNGKNKALRFMVYRIRDEQQSAIREAINGGDKDTIKAAFQTVYSTLALKAVGATQGAFTSAFNNVLEGARDADYARTQAQRQLYRTVQRYGTEEYLNGLRDGGIDIEGDSELDRDDKRTINRLLSEAAGYIGDFMARIYNTGISDVLADTKADQWFSRTILPFGAAGLLAADENGIYEFGGEDGLEPCDDCPRLKGQRHRFSEWVERGYVPPYGANLGCADGGHCKHRLTRVAGRARGAW